MAIIRTALALIGFGFTIYQFFGALVRSADTALGARAPGNFGIALASLGILLLTLGIVYHARYMWDLRRERREMARAGLIHGRSPYPASLTLVTAGLLWVLGLLAVVSMTFQVRVFG